MIKLGKVQARDVDVSNNLITTANAVHSVIVNSISVNLSGNKLGP